MQFHSKIQAIDKCFFLSVSLALQTNSWTKCQNYVVNVGPSLIRI